MGKGTIISHTGDGQYQVSVQYNVERVQAEKAANLAKIANLEAQIAEETDDQKLNVLKLQKLSLEKRNEVLDAIPESKEVTAWCADLTEDLTGDVGLIEVPGESVAFNIQPGYEGNAAYNATRDGQLTPTLAMTPAAAFYNLAMLPGWQKWKPTYRYGTITAIDGDLADVALDAATSTQQSLGVNQASTLTDVPVEYMSCNGAAFEVGDEVLVKFTGQDWAMPVVVGFKDNPEICSGKFIKIRVNNLMVVWDIAKNEPLDVSTVPALAGKEWPVSSSDSDVNDWWSGTNVPFMNFNYIDEFDTDETGFDGPPSHDRLNCKGGNISYYAESGPVTSPYSGRTVFHQGVQSGSVSGSGPYTSVYSESLIKEHDQDIMSLSFRDENKYVYKLREYSWEANRTSSFNSFFSGPCLSCSADGRSEQTFSVYSQIKTGETERGHGVGVYISEYDNTESYCTSTDTTITRTGLFMEINDFGDYYVNDSSYSHVSGNGFGIFGVAFGMGTVEENNSYWTENKFLIYSGEWGGGLGEDGFPENLAPFSFNPNTAIEQYLKNNMSISIVNTFTLEIS